MQLVVQKSLIAILVACMLAVLGVSVVSAEEASDASVSAEVRTEVEPSARPRPLQIFHEKRLDLQRKAQEAIGNIRHNAGDVRTDMRDDLKTATSGAERRNVLKDAREKQEELRDRQKELRGNLKERLQALVRTHLGSALARLSAATRHFENIIERIESRIEKLKERGVDTTAVEASLVSAVDLTATAKANVESLKDFIGSITDASEPSTVKTQISEAIREAVASVKAAHQALIQTARELSALIKVSTGNNGDDVDADN